VDVVIPPNKDVAVPLVTSDGIKVGGLDVPSGSMLNGTVASVSTYSGPLPGSDAVDAGSFNPQEVDASCTPTVVSITVLDFVVVPDQVFGLPVKVTLAVSLQVNREHFFFSITAS